MHVQGTSPFCCQIAVDLPQLWVLTAVSAVSVEARMRYRSELSLERRRLMLGGTTFDSLTVKNKPAGTHSSSEQHSIPS